MLGGLEVKAEALPTVPLDLAPADVAAIQPALHLALCRIEEHRLTGDTGLTPGDGAFAGRRFSSDMYARLRGVYDKLEDGPGTHEVDDIELRILAFASRNGRRHLSHPSQVPPELEDKIELIRKRAKRKARAEIGKGAYRELAQRWNAFRKWCRSYIFVSPKLSARRRAENSEHGSAAKPKETKRPIAELLNVARDVINPDSKFGREPRFVRQEMLQLLREVKRGRWGVDIEDFCCEPEATRDTIAEFLRRRGHSRDLRKQFMDLATLQSMQAARARKLMDRSDEVEEAERAAEAAERAAAAQQAAAAKKPQENTMAPLLTSPNAAAASAAGPLSTQKEPSENELKVCLANWLVSDVLPEDRFTVFKQVLTRLHCGESVPFSARQFSFADCRPTQRADRVKFYADWALTWLLSWTADLVKAQAVVGWSLDYAHKRWISIPVLERERIVAEIHLRHFNETAAGPGYLHSCGARS